MRPGIPREVLLQAVAATNGVVREQECPFPGSHLYTPSAPGSHPALVVLHGSEGASAGFTAYSAIRLASQGYAALAFGYFGEKGLAPTLARVDLGRAILAARWLRESASVRGRPLALVGASRGAEQALLIASILRDTSLVAAVAVHAATSVVWGSWDPTKFATVMEHGQTVAAWTHHGQPLPDAMPIAIESYAGPVFMSHGTKDTVWPSRYTEELAARLRAARRDVVVSYLEGEGHVPSPAAWARMSEQRLLFLRRTLDPSS